MEVAPRYIALNTAYTVHTVYTVYTIQTALHCWWNSSIYAYIYIVMTIRAPVVLKKTQKLAGLFIKFIFIQSNSF